MLLYLFLNYDFFTFDGLFALHVLPIFAMHMPLFLMIFNNIFLITSDDLQWSLFNFARWSLMISIPFHTMTFDYLYFISHDDQTRSHDLFRDLEIFGAYIGSDLGRSVWCRSSVQKLAQTLGACFVTALGFIHW